VHRGHHGGCAFCAAEAFEWVSTASWYLYITSLPTPIFVPALFVDSYGTPKFSKLPLFIGTDGGVAIMHDGV
jgi:hypothetical protein